MNCTSTHVKNAAKELGADLCGIATADRFTEAPGGHHPTDVLPECKSVIVLACEFPRSSLNGGLAAYTCARDQMDDKMDALAGAMAESLKSLGVIAFPKKASGPCKWDESNRLRDIISLKHAAALAGLGRIGKNTLLINNKYGNMLWLSAVLTSAALDADPVATYEACLPECSLCIESCPVGALGNEFMEQRLCQNHAFRKENGAEQVLCYSCRQVCPRCLGI